MNRYNFRKERDIDASALKPPLETDLLKLHRGKVGGQFWSVFVKCKPEDPNWNEDHVSWLFLISPFGEYVIGVRCELLISMKGAVRDTLEQIDVIKRLIAEHEEVGVRR